MRDIEVIWIGISVDVGVPFVTNVQVVYLPYTDYICAGWDKSKSETNNSYLLGRA